MQPRQLQEEAAHSRPGCEVQEHDLLCDPGRAKWSLREVAVKQAWDIKPKQSVSPHREGQLCQGPQHHVGKADGQDPE